MRNHRTTFLRAIALIAAGSVSSCGSTDGCNIRYTADQPNSPCPATPWALANTACTPGTATTCGYTPASSGLQHVDCTCVVQADAGTTWSCMNLAYCLGPLEPPTLGRA